ncbi:MAG: hypothetical protein KGI06_02630 [Candidatus Micrarchaeota archaeon]|nr:hypothetical protein [Candidatus Micrarchaeota archaeon]
MAYDSYYRKDKAENKEERKDEEVTISIESPLMFWVGLLLIAALLQLVILPFASHYGRVLFKGVLEDFANYLIYIPGIVVMPLVISLWVGDRVSYIRKGSQVLAYKGLLNALYTSLVYSISIFIIYILMRFSNGGVLANLSVVTFSEYLIVIPFAINMIVIPIFAILSAERRHG